jgi:hypothetical protein
MPSFALARARPPSRVSVVRSLLSSPLTAPRRPWQVLRASPRSTGRGMSTNCRHCRQAWRARTTSALRGHCWRGQLPVLLTSVAQAHPRPGAARRGRRAVGARGRALEPCQQGTAGGRRRAGRGSAGSAPAVPPPVWAFWCGVAPHFFGWAGGRATPPRAAVPPTESGRAVAVKACSGREPGLAPRRGHGGERRRRRRSSVARPELVWCVCSVRAAAAVRPRAVAAARTEARRCGARRSAPAAAAACVASRGESRRRRA